MIRFALARRQLARLLLAGTCGFAITAPAMAQDAAVLDRLSALEARLDALQAENTDLRAEVETLREAQSSEEDTGPAPQIMADTGFIEQAGGPRDTEVTFGDEAIGTSSAYAYRILDHAENVNTKPLVQLAAIQNGELPARVTASGAITAIANYQWSNRPSKFGYLMRNPTSANQIGDEVSEALLHSAQFAVTARLTPSITGYAELHYDPQQSFGPGTITALTRNQISLRRGWVMLGNLDKAPVYALIGKMDTPFGLNDTVSPFTNSTNWHAFSGLAYGAQAGYVSGGLHVRAMAIQGGAQFRAANTPVNGTNVPSRLNNFAVDGRYTLGLGNEGTIA